MLTFTKDIEVSWDFAVENLRKNTDNTDIKLLCDIYLKAYETTHYQSTNECDEGLCFEIRQFVIEKIFEIYERENNNGKG